MVLETPSYSPSCLTWCCLCSMMQKRRKRLPAAIVGPFPVVTTALSSSDRYPDPALCADITPRQVQLTEKPVSLLLNKAVQGSCTLFSAQSCAELLGSELKPSMSLQHLQQRAPAFARAGCGECGPIPVLSRAVTCFAFWKINCFHLLPDLPCPSSSLSVVPTSYLRTGGRCRAVAAGYVGVEEPETLTQVLPGAFRTVLPAIVSRKLRNFCSPISSW